MLQKIFPDHIHCVTIHFQNAHSGGAGSEDGENYSENCDFFLSQTCRVADRVLVLRLGVRPEPLRWESRGQDIGPTETSRPHVISNSESSPRDLNLNAKTQLHSVTSKLQC